MRAALLLALMPLAAAAQEGAMFACTTGDGAAFLIRLDRPSRFGPPVHCIEQIDLGGAPPCAPQGGWGLADPSDPGETAAIAQDPREAGAWDGPKLFAFLGPTRLVASASSGPGIPLTLEIADATTWRLTLDLATGGGSIFTPQGETPFSCERPVGWILYPPP